MALGAGFSRVVADVDASFRKDCAFDGGGDRVCAGQERHEACAENAELEESHSDGSDLVNLFVCILKSSSWLIVCLARGRGAIREEVAMGCILEMSAHSLFISDFLILMTGNQAVLLFQQCM